VPDSEDHITLEMFISVLVRKYMVQASGQCVRKCDSKKVNELP
jgi:hypothetical protein